MRFTIKKILAAAAVPAAAVAVSPSVLVWRMRLLRTAR